MKKLASLSVFFPAYNEEGNIAQTVTKALKVLPKVAHKWELIVVNDGSTDKTASNVKNLQVQEKRIRLISHRQNQGYGSALKTGLYQAKYDWIAFTDSDGQFDFSEIIKFLPLAGQADLVIGYRLDRQDSLLRKFFGWGWTLLSNLLLGIKVRDVDCAFKLLKKEVIKRIDPLVSERGGMISPELLAKARKKGYQIAQIGVHHYPRQEGHQTGAGLKVILSSFVDLGKLWWQIK
ncbi:glycosyltransferase family 2 protein [Patescibacteria group bacterium]